MQVKGISFIARKQEVINRFGEDSWIKFKKKISKKLPYFNRNILPITNIPIQAFLDFQDELIKEFFNNDTKMYWTLGEESAEWALTKGPYKSFIRSKNIETFIEQRMPFIWNSYFTEGDMEINLDNEIIHIKVHTPILHIYFEYLIMGYTKKALELVGAQKVEVKRIKGVSVGDKEIYYQFIIKS